MSGSFSGSFFRSIPGSIALVTAIDNSVPDRETVLLQAALQEQGIVTDIVGWDQPVDWEQYSLALIRSPWDYHLRLDEFLAWAERVSEITCLLNPVQVINWNSHKGYLLDLQAEGIPVLPTSLLKCGAHSSHSQALLPQLLDQELIMKPAVGIGAYGIQRGFWRDPEFQQRLASLSQTVDVLVQPFLEEVLTKGEISLVFLAGEFSHAVRKTPKSGDFRVQAQYGGTVEEYSATPQEIELGYRILSRVPGNQLEYARVDLVQPVDGPYLMELEVIEPELFLRFHTLAISRWAARLIDRVRFELR